MERVVVPQYSQSYGSEELDKQTRDSTRSRSPYRVP